MRHTDLHVWIDERVLVLAERPRLKAELDPAEREGDWAISFLGRLPTFRKLGEQTQRQITTARQVQGIDPGCELGDFSVRSNRAGGY